MTRTIRNLELAEIKTLLDWAAGEGWNPGLHDAAAFQAADPHGFFGAFVDGVMVAGISAVAYDDAFGFIGLYICHPDYRGRGHGKAVWDAGMGYLGSRSIGLDGVPQQQANYARMGFVGAYETVRMSGTLAPADHALPAGRLEDIGEIDRQCFPSRRDNFLRHWIAEPRDCIIHRTNGVVDGYAVSRACHQGQKIGPLFAETHEAAIRILTAYSGLVHLDVPAHKTEWLTALRNLGLQPGFATQRMYKGPAPSVCQEHVFGVSTLELG